MGWKKKADAPSMTSHSRSVKHFPPQVTNRPFHHILHRQDYRDKGTNTSTPSGDYLATILPWKYSPQTHPPPNPNPRSQRPPHRREIYRPRPHRLKPAPPRPIDYTATLGSHLAGTVLSTGSSAPTNMPRPSTHVAAFAPCSFVQGTPDHGALQTRVLVPATNAVPLPEGWACSRRVWFDGGGDGVVLVVHHAGLGWVGQQYRQRGGAGGGVNGV